MESARRKQFLYVRGVIQHHPELTGKTYQEVHDFLVEKNQVMPGCAADRSAAMIVSFLRGNTIDEDVQWI